MKNVPSADQRIEGASVAGACALIIWGVVHKNRSPPPA
jgi:hypothetical protein